MLAIAPETNSLFQVIHSKEVVFPLRIEHAEHDHALVVAHGIRPNQLFFCVVTLFEPFKNGVAQFLPIQRLRLDAFGKNVHTESSEDRIFQALQIPVFGMNFGRTVLLEQFTENARDIILKDQFLLIHAFEQLAAEAINCLALLIHYVVVLEQMLASFEILRFNGFLRFLAIENLVPLIRGNNVFVPSVVPDCSPTVFLGTFDFALRGANWLGDSLLHALLLGHEFWVAAEQDVGSTAGHVGGDRYGGFASGLGNDFGFALVLLSVQNPVFHAFFLEQLGKALGFFD